MTYGTDLRDFSAAATIRAIKTAAQTAVALIGTNAIGMSDVNWTGIVSGAVLAAIVSVLTSVATGLPEAGGESPLARHLGS